jgi:hypothetical protein
VVAQGQRDGGPRDAGAIGNGLKTGLGLRVSHSTDSVNQWRAGIANEKADAYGSRMKTIAIALLTLVGVVSANAQVENITLEARGHGPCEKTTIIKTVAGPETNSPAVQVTIPDNTEGKKYRVNAKGVVAGAIAADKPVTLSFMARSPGSNKVLVMVHAGTNPDRVKLISDTPLTPEWKAYKIKGAKPEAFAAGEASVDFMMGEKAGVIEISKVVLTQ